MMKEPLPARPRKFSGAIVLALMMSAGSYAAWAAQPAQPAAAKAKAPATQEPAAQRLTRITDNDRLDPPAFPKGVNVNGKVELELLVGVDGHVKDVKVISSEPAGVFDQLAVDAARKWYVTPTLKNGVAVEQRIITPVEFRADVEPKQD